MVNSQVFKKALIEITLSTPSIFLSIYSNSVSLCEISLLMCVSANRMKGRFAHFHSAYNRFLESRGKSRHH